MLFPAVLVTQWLNRKTSMKIRKKLKLLLSIKKAKDNRQCLGLKTFYLTFRRDIGSYFDAHRKITKEKKK